MTYDIYANEHLSISGRRVIYFVNFTIFGSNRTFAFYLSYIFGNGKKVEFYTH